MHGTRAVNRDSPAAQAPPEHEFEAESTSHDCRTRFASNDPPSEQTKSPKYFQPHTSVVALFEAILVPSINTGLHPINVAAAFRFPQPSSAALYMT